MEPSCLLSFLALALTFTMNLAADHASAAHTMGNSRVDFIIGAIVDGNSRIGKEEIAAMKMAVEDFNEYSSQNLSLHIRDSQGEPMQAALAAQDLIATQVRAIVGPDTWEETNFVAEVGNKNQIPVLSFADSAPTWAVERWPFLLQVSPNKYAQMKAIAAIVQSWEWHEVTVIYEDTDSSITGIMPHLLDALKDVEADIIDVVALPPFASSSLSEKLKKLKRRQCRVFVVHLSYALAVRLFEMAKILNMMEKDYVWITTDAFTSLIYSFNASILSSMPGIVGVKGYFPEDKPRYHVFNQKFQNRFSLEHPEEKVQEPGIFAVQAYNAIWMAALAIRDGNSRGLDLFKKISLSDFDGLTGRVQFIDQRVPPMHIFQIINVVGKSYREVGFWSDGLGFSNTASLNATHNSSMKDLGQVFWPGGPWNTPRGWTIPADAQPLNIGVPNQSIFKQYVTVEFDPQQNETSVKGYAVELFKATVAHLPFYLPYKFTPFNGTYTDLVHQIYLKKFDAAVGDITIVTDRMQFVDFTHPYAESDLVMIVPVRPKTKNKAWLFMRPFTTAMWFLITFITIYNGFVVWLIERSHSSKLRGTVLNQVGVLLWLSFTTLFSLQGAKLHSNLSRLTMVVWLFVALIITQTYTANLSSILTVQELEPAVDSIESLRSSNAVVGYFKVTFVAKYMVDILHFNPKNMKNYSTPEDCIKDLRNKQVAAVFLVKPWAKIFLARYCKGFTIASPSFKSGGFAFAFPKASPLLPYVAEALMEVSESGQLNELEKHMLVSQHCEEDLLSQSEDETSSLSPGSFWMLFIFTGGASTIALTIFVILQNHKTLQMLMFTVVKQWRHRRKKLSMKVSDEENRISSVQIEL